MKKISMGIVKVIVYVLTFFVAFFAISHFLNKGNTDMTVEMRAAVFPTVSFLAAGEQMNLLHGYAQEMDCGLQRDTIQPVQMDRKVNFRIDKYGQKVGSISYQVRSVDGSRLIEDNAIEEFEENKTQIFGEIVLKDLIEENREYELVLQIQLEGGQTVYYYTRILQSGDNHAVEKLQFVKEFHEKTFNKEEAESLAMYLESDATGDNTTLGYTNIHSSLDQVSWGNCMVSVQSEPIVSIKEMDGQTGVFCLDYIVRLQQGRDRKYYQVRENYRIRYTTDRVYLLDFERTMEQFLDEDAPIFANNKIELGIQKQAVQLAEDDSGSIVAFVVNGSLYSYNTADEKLAVLFSFYDKENWDERTYYREHDIRILNVDEGGNVQFMVYGYMNRGKREGQVGIQVYSYNASMNTIEEALYIPYDMTFQVLKAEMERLCYLSKDNNFFFQLQDTVYVINLETLKCQTVAADLQEGSYWVSDSNKMFVWQEMTDGEPRALILKNLTTMEEHRIEAGSGKVVVPLGFMGEDLIYGIADRNDVMLEPTGRKLYLVQELRIENERHKVLKTFSPEESYIIDCRVEDNQISLSRVRLTEEGDYVEAEDAQIMSAKNPERKVNSIEPVVTERYEKIYQIVLKSSINIQTVKVTTPKEVLYEGARELAMEHDTDKERYYVYRMGEVLGVYPRPAEAVEVAYKNAGAVVTEDGSYAWRKSTRSLKNQIMAIKGGTAADENTTKLAVCLDAMLEYAGVSRRTQTLLSQGKSAMEILRQNLSEIRILDLSGNTLDSLLYYINLDDPVLAVSRDSEEAMLLIGYNEYNIVVMDPEDGTVYKKGLNDSKTLFEDGRWQFITVLLH